MLAEHCHLGCAFWDRRTMNLTDPTSNIYILVSLLLERVVEVGACQWEVAWIRTWIDYASPR